MCYQRYYCDQATIKRKDILWYLSDETEEERAALIHALCSYSYTPDELNQALAVVSPQLATYLKQFKKMLVLIIDIEYGSIDASLKRIHGLRLFKAIGEVVISLAIEDFKTYEVQKTMYPVSAGMKPYQILCKMDPGIAANTSEKNGTSEQWQKLALDLQKAKSLSNLCVDRMCAVQNLTNEFGDYLTGSSDGL